MFHSILEITPMPFLNARSIQTRRWLVRFLFALCLAFFAGCSNSVDEDTLDMWTNNAEGLERIQELMEDPDSTSRELRIRALEIIASKRRPAEIPRMLRSAPDGLQLADAYLERNLPKLQGADEKAAVLRDGLIRAIPFCSPAWKEKAKKRIAEWAFQGLSKKSSKDEIKTQIERRIRVNQLPILGKHGWVATGLLIRHGWNLAELTTYLSKEKDREAQEILAESLIALHKTNPTYEWPSLQLRFIEAGGSGQAFVPMFELYQNEEADDETRDDALNAALACAERALKDPRTKKATLTLLESILKGPSVDDRWIAMNVLVEQLGDDAVEKCIGSLTESVDYTLAQQDTPEKSMVDFCGDTLKKHAKKSNAKVLKLLKTGNNVQKAFAIVCAKVWKHEASRSQLRKLAGARRSPSLKSVFPEVKNLAALAQNALDGLTINKEIEKAQKSGKMSEREAKRRKFLVTVLISKTGDDLRKEIDETLAEEMKSWTDESVQPKK